MKSKVIAIAAISRTRRALGYKNDLLWRIPSDLARFKKITSGHPVIMGFNTYTSLPHLLPNRTNIVMSLAPDTAIEGAIVVVSPEEALKAARSAPGADEVYVIGGGMIYTALLPYTDELNLTIVDDEPNADIFFPDYTAFSEIVSEERREANGLHYTYTILKKP